MNQNVPTPSEKWPQERCDKALGKLRELYRDREDRSALHYETPFELLIAVILSAQCTDERVNKVTAELFKFANTPEKVVEAGYDRVYDAIKSCGIAKNKAANILATSKLLMEEYDSKVPETIEELQKLPGVGKKTANVVASNAFGVPAIAVDTHVNRVSKRIGLADGKNVTIVERELQERIPMELWSKAHHWLIYHGREVCKARKPDCEHCVLRDDCRYYQTEVLPAQEEAAAEAAEIES